MRVRKIRIDRILSIILLLILASTTIMFGIKLMSGKSYKEVPVSTYIFKEIKTLDAEKIHIASLLAKKIDQSTLSEEEIKKIEEKKKNVINLSKENTTLEKLQIARKELELFLYDIESKSKLKEGMSITDGVIKVNNQIVVNKKFALPETFNPGEIPEAKNAFLKLINAMQAEKIAVSNSYLGYYDFEAQRRIYSEAFYIDGSKMADKKIARAGHSEHQTGLTYTVLNRSGKPLGSNAEDEKAIDWIRNNAKTFGFIIRFPKGKERITGFEADAGTLRYVGLEVAKEISEKETTFEEHFGIEGGDYAK